MTKWLRLSTSTEELRIYTHIVPVTPYNVDGGKRPKFTRYCDFFSGASNLISLQATYMIFSVNDCIVVVHLQYTVQIATIGHLHICSDLGEF